MNICYEMIAAACDTTVERCLAIIKASQSKIARMKWLRHDRKYGLDGTTLVNTKFLWFK